jgi:hypothetical protein
MDEWDVTYTLDSQPYAMRASPRAGGLSKPWVGVGLPNICKGSLALSKTAAAPWQLRLGFTCAHSHICSFLIRPRTRRRRRRKLP